jgi:hypothetical protein
VRKSTLATVDITPDACHVLPVCRQRHRHRMFSPTLYPCVAFCIYVHTNYGQPYHAPALTLSTCHRQFLPRKGCLHRKLYFPGALDEPHEHPVALRTAVMALVVCTLFIDHASELLPPALPRIPGHRFVCASKLISCLLQPYARSRLFLEHVERRSASFAPRGNRATTSFVSPYISIMPCPVALACLPLTGICNSRRS